MADEDEDITIDLRLRDYLTQSTAAAAAAMDDLADNTRKAARALLLLDKRADGAAKSLTQLALAARAANTNIIGLDTSLKSANTHMQESTQIQRNMSRRMQQTSNAAKQQVNRFKDLRGAGQKLIRMLGMLVPAIMMLGKAMVMAGGAAAAGHLIGQLLLVAAAMSQLLSFAALLPVAIGAVAGVVVAAKMAFKDFGKVLEKQYPGIIKQYKELQKYIQGVFIEDLGKNVPKALEKMFPVIKDGLRGIVSEFAKTANQIATFFTTNAGKKMFQNFFAAGASAVGVLRKNIGPFLQGLGKMVDAVMPSWNRLMKAADGGFKQFNAWISRISSDGTLKEWLDNAFVIAKQLFAILGSLGSVISGVIKAAGGAGTGAGALGAFGEILGEISKWVNSFEGQTAIQSFFTALGQIVQAVIPLLTVLANIIGTVLAPALADIVTGIAPGVTKFFEAIGVALQKLSPHMGPLATAFGELLIALTPLLPVIGQLAAVLVSSFVAVLPIITPLVQLLAEAMATYLGPVLENALNILSVLAPVFAAFAESFASYLPQIIPLIQQFGTLLMEAFNAGLSQLIGMLPQLMPMITQLGALLGEHLLVWLQQLAPLMPMIVQTIAQWGYVMIPLLPAVLQLALLMVQLTTATQPLIPIMVLVIAVFVQFAATAVDRISMVISAIAAIITWAVNMQRKINTAIGIVVAIVSNLGSVWQRVKVTVVGAINSIVGAINGAIGAVGNLIEKAKGLMSIDINPFRFAGGPVQGGKAYTVNELGPEMFVSNTGKTSMIGSGAYDNNWTPPSDGTVIPAFLTKAFRSLEDLEVANGGITSRELAAIMETREPEEHHHYHVPVTIMGNVSQEIDVERAVTRALDKAERDRKERK